jgi:coenzyme PQQ synthesis protein D (PqqD)
MRSDDALWRRMPDRILVAAADGDEVLVLTGPGAVLWDLWIEPVSVEEASDALAELYMTDRRVVMTDILPLFDRLAEERIILATDGDGVG